MTSLNKKNLVIIGATGFVGRRFCQYLLDQSYYEKCNLIFTARNIKKLSQIFPQKDEDQRFQVVNLDTLDERQVRDSLKNADIVANFVGPFDLYAEKVVAFCAKNGIHYFDITGEFHFIKKMKSLYQKDATETGSCLIPFSGFDSIPSEVATYKSISKFRDQFKKDPTKVEHLFKMKGGFNGGTIASAMNFGKQVSFKDVLDDHYLLKGASKKVKKLPKPKYFNHQKLWGIPFFMEPVNSKIVFQGLYQKGEEQLFENLLYSEHMNIHKSFGKLSHTVSNHFFNIFNLSLGSKAGQALMKPFLPSPGEGPSEKSVNSGFFDLITIASDNECFVETRLKGAGDPGNKVTVNCMLSILDCFLQEDNHPTGFCSPYFAFEHKLIENLKNHEINFQE